MSDLPSRVSELTAFVESGAERSAAAIFGEIVHEFLQSIYPVSRPQTSAPPPSLVHYTGLETLFSMLDRDKPGYLRLYDTIHSNDPTEGVFFDDHLKNNAAALHASLPSLILNHHPGYAYISSFIRASKNRASDKLKYWLAYGRNGHGCSIAIPYSDFSPGLPILRVQYGKAAVELVARQIVSLFKHFPTSILQHFAPGTSAVGSSSPFNVFSSIPYFHKPRSYSYEAECRLFLSPIDRLCDPKYQPKYTVDGTPTVRHYVEHDSLRLGGVFFTGTVITLGPSIPRRENVKRALDALLRCHHLSGARVVCSRIPYRPSAP